MTKLLRINKCDECPHFDFDPQEDPETWGKVYCHKLESVISTTTSQINIPIPDDCPLENA